MSETLTERFFQKSNNFRAFSIVGLVVMTFGGGCLKPLLGTYGAQQYKDTDVKNIALFFSLYYFMYNCGSITSRVVNPILRQDVKCFGNDDCFALAFGIPGIFMILVALIIIVVKRYSNAPPQATGNTLLNVFACIWVSRYTQRNVESNNAWSVAERDRYEN